MSMKTQNQINELLGRVERLEQMVADLLSKRRARKDGTANG